MGNATAWVEPNAWSVVVPTNRPEKLSSFLEAWGPYFSALNAHLIVVHDAPEVPDWAADVSAEHHAWNTIGLEHGARRTDMVRSWGIYRAWKHGSSFTLTLDDDVLPRGFSLFREYEAVFENGAPLSPYLNVGCLTSYGKPLRGFPFADRSPVEVAVQYGGWDGVLDYDAPTQLAGVPDDRRFVRAVLPVPHGIPVTGCIMNCAWRTRYAPIMWQLPLIDGKFNRFGDIWSGLFQKRTLDHHGSAMVVNGKATVLHNRASDPIANLEREAPGIPVNETLWRSLTVEGDSLVDRYRSVTNSAAHHFRRFDSTYADTFLDARDEWLGLF